jgi:hypothetical protein
MSAYSINTNLKVFENLLNPDLFDLEAPIFYSASSRSSQDVNTPQSNFKDKHNLPSLESLLYRNPTYVNFKTHDIPVYKKPTESILQTQRWVEIRGPDGTPILQKLPNHRPETPAPRINDSREWQSRRITPARYKPVPGSDHCVVATETRRVPVKYPRRKAQVSQTPKRRSKYS